MSLARVPCPNPICPHDFTPEEHAAALSCPRCGTALVALPPTDAPTAPLAPPAVPFASPVSATDLMPPAVEPFPTVPRPARRGVPFGLLVPVLVTGLFFAILVAGLLVLFNRHTLDTDAAGGATALKDLNCSFRKPDSRTWRASESLRRALDGVLAFEREDPQIGMVLAARDYKARNPRSDELHAEALSRIHTLVRNAAIEEPSGAPVLAGQAARRLVFQGEIGEVSMSGECSMFAHRGIAYWLLIWTPTAEVERARDEFAALRASLTLLNERANWRETGGGSLFTAADRSFSLRDVDGWWEANEPATDYAPEAQLALRLKRKKLRDSDKDPTAEVVVFVLPSAGAPQETARKFVTEWQRKGPYKEAVVEDWRDRVPGELPPAPAGPAGVFAAPQRLRVKKTSSLSDYALLAAVEHGGHVYAVWCACQKPRDWEPAFRILLESFRFKGE